jgi:hypothetical protein
MSGLELFFITEFDYVKIMFVIFYRKKIGGKAALKMLAILIPGQHHQTSRGQAEHSNKIHRGKQNSMIKTTSIRLHRQKFRKKNLPMPAL